jgi:Tfp pilus assembly protein PilE
MIELMMTVVILGILTAVAIYAFSKNARKARAAEVTSMFAELQSREETYRSLNGNYLSTVASEGTYFPTSITGGSSKTTLGALPAAWTTLKIDTQGGGLYCQYAVIAGAANSTTGMGSIGTTLYATTPAQSWYYLLAQCDWDGNSAVNSIYARRGDSEDLVKINEGR